MSQISDIRNPWRDILLSEPASFRGVVFHVDSGSRSSGRRAVVHEYPKRNLPYAEDMGRHAKRFQFTGYLIYRPRKSFEQNPLLYDYVTRRNELYDALEADDIGKLVHPVFAPGGMQVLCERYSMTESRERGGYTQFDMSFVEAGTPVSFTQAPTNTKANVGTSADSADKAALDLMAGIAPSIG